MSESHKKNSSNIALLYSKNLDAASKEIGQSDGHVIHVLSQDTPVFVASLPESTNTDDLKHSQATPFEDLKEETHNIIEAWKQTDLKLKSDITDDAEGLTWDVKGRTAPKKLEPTEVGLSKDLGLQPPVTSLAFSDSIAHQTVIVSGPGTLTFNKAEIAIVMQQVIQGAHFLATANQAANVTMSYTFKHVTVGVQPNPKCTVATCEKLWRDPMLTQLGYSTGYQGMTEMVNAVKTSHKSDWAYAALFTKYPLHHFAYAPYWAGYLVMQYSNDGWGVNNIHRVFAHETGHVFGANDEYGTCNCDPSGVLNVPNINCVNCDHPSIPLVDCLMKGNTLSICNWTWGQLGWGHCKLSNDAIDQFAGWASSGAQVVFGDFNGDGKTDMALLGVAEWTTLPVAFSNGDGTYNVTNKAIDQFTAWAATPGVKIVTGDFNGNGKTDIALTGVAGWSTLPIAFSNGDGTFNVTNEPIDQFAAWASAGPEVITGDFNGNGKIDIALTGVSGWTTLPVAFSNGDGTFNVTNSSIDQFGSWASSGAKIVAGDFNGNGKMDIALTGVSGWTSLPVAFSNGDGTFNVTNKAITGFAEWAGSGAKVIVGDFNGNGKMDIALTGVNGWTTLPIAFSNGDGTFVVTNNFAEGFSAWSTAAGVQVITGDFNGDGKTDIALTGVAGWLTLPVALSKGNGSFDISNINMTSFAQWAADASSVAVTGKFLGGSKDSIALVCGAGWASVPMATYQDAYKTPLLLEQQSS